MKCEIVYQQYGRSSVFIVCSDLVFVYFVEPDRQKCVTCSWQVSCWILACKKNLFMNVLTVYHTVSSLLTGD